MLAVKNYLKTGPYPKEMAKNNTEKYKLRRRCKDNFKLGVDGAFLYSPKPRKNADEASRKWKQVVEEKEQQVEIMKGLHCSSLGGHQGINKTKSRIISRFYWDNMSADIEKFVRACQQCQMVNSKHFVAGTPPLHPIPVTVAEPWYQIGIDLVGPMPLTKDGFKYVCTVTDYFTKYPEAAAIKSKCAEEVAHVIYLRIMCRHGCPSIIISDQGREFCNKAVEALCVLMKTTHRVTSPYHPQTNGQTEKFNGTLEKMLLKHCYDHQHDWDVYLESCLFAYRTTRHSTTRYTPFFLEHGREAKLIEQMSVTETTTKSPPATTCTATLEDYNTRSGDLADFRQSIGKPVLGNIVKAQEIQKIHFDKRHHSCKPFKIGDLVLKRNDRKDDRKGGKFELSWTGPYQVVEASDKGTYTLMCERSKNVLKRKTNGSKLKAYLRPESSPRENTISKENPEPQPSTSQIVQYSDSD